MSTRPIKKMHEKCCCGPRWALGQQSGIVTLLTSVVILLLATILAVGVARTALMEQRISANEIRKRQAFEAAEFGISYALNYLNAKAAFAGNPLGHDVDRIWPEGADKDNNTVADTIPVTLVSADKNKYSVAFCSQATAISAIVCPDAPGAISCTPATGLELVAPRIAACGWSDDGYGRVKITQGIGVIAGDPQPQTNPLVSKGTMNVTGSATVTNYFNNLTVWTGGPLSNIGNSGKTFVRNPTVAPPVAGTAPPAPPTGSCGVSTNYICATDKNSTGPDVIASDPTLSNLTNDQLFELMMGKTWTKFQDETHTVAAADANQLNGFLGQTLLIDGTVGNIPATLGSRNSPVKLVINGDWNGAGNTTIYGIVYVRGNVNLSGNITIYGGATVQGGVEGTGSLDVIYDPFVTVGAATGTGKPGILPGSWRDW